MRDVLMLSGALLANLVGLAWFALAMDVHWQQVRGAETLSPRAVRWLRLGGAVCLALALLLCQAVDHISMAALVWFMSLAGAALLIAFTLSWRPHWLAPLVAWQRRSAAVPPA
jgi:hypothetical protein